MKRKSKNYDDTDLLSALVPFLAALILLVICVAGLSGCKPAPTKPTPVEVAATYNEQLHNKIITLDSLNTLKTSQVMFLTDSIQKLHVSLDSLKSSLFVSNYKIERVKYYLKICYKKPSQDVFLKGWVNRAVQ